MRTTIHRENPYSFGMNLQGRSFVGEANRFGYQGSERDAEALLGSAYTTEFRMLDVRLGRWFSPDPITHPWQSPYCSMDNNPVALTDIMGLTTGDQTSGTNGAVTMGIQPSSAGHSGDDQFNGGTEATVPGFDFSSFAGSKQFENAANATLQYFGNSSGVSITAKYSQDNGGMGQIIINTSADGGYGLDIRYQDGKWSYKETFGPSTIDGKYSASTTIDHGGLPAPIAEIVDEMFQEQMQAWANMYGPQAAEPIDFTELFLWESKAASLTTKLIFNYVGSKLAKSTAIKVAVVVAKRAVETKAAKGISVIGPRATYRQFAKDIGANFLNVADDAWTWEKNLTFLQGVVKRGDDVVFAGKFNPNQLNKISVLAKEIKYLESHGYQWTSDFTKMILKK